MYNKKETKIKAELYRDNFQNSKRYDLPKAQLIIADIPYNIGNNAFASNPAWYNDGDNTKGESKLANSNFFNTDVNFNVAEFMHFVSKMLVREPKERGKAPCMIMFCSFEQQMPLIELAKRYGLNNYINLVFRKNFSAQVLKANMRIVGNCEYGLLFYRDKLPKFNNNGKMVMNCIDWERDGRDVPKHHPTQKPLALLKRLIKLFTDEGDIVIDPCAGSGSTLIASLQTGRNSYGFEIDRHIYKDAKNWVDTEKQNLEDIKEFGFAKKELAKKGGFLFQ